MGAVRLAIIIKFRLESVTEIFSLESSSALVSSVNKLYAITFYTSEISLSILSSVASILYSTPFSTGGTSVNLNSSETLTRAFLFTPVFITS
jgi:hypothetical protein